MIKSIANISNQESTNKLLQDCICKKIKQKRCAELLGLSVRQVKRKCKALRDKKDVKALIHGNTNKKPQNITTDAIREHIIQCCNTMFHGYGPTLVSYEYQRMYGIKLAVETTRQIMIANGIWVAKDKKIKRVHNMRERMACFGEMVQAGGTEYDWFGDGNKYVMLVFIDDATSSLLHAVLVKSESSFSYMEALNDYLLKHGRPMCLYTDKHGVFRVNMPSAPEGSQTQFARAMEALDIKMIQAHSPQAKGRVERANRTLQDRLAKRFQLLGIKSVEVANYYLQSEYIAEYNKLFAVAPTSSVNAHRPLNSQHNLEQILAIHDTRHISKNHTLQYNNQVIQIMNESVNLHKKVAKVIAKADEVTHVLVEDRLVQFRVLKIKPKQDDVTCAKMINLAVKQAKDNILINNATNTLDKLMAVLL